MEGIQIKDYKGLINYLDGHGSLGRHQRICFPETMSQDLGVLILVLSRQPSRYLVGTESMAGAQEKNQNQCGVHSSSHTIPSTGRITYLKRRERKRQREREREREREIMQRRKGKQTNFESHLGNWKRSQRRQQREFKYKAMTMN